MKVGWVAYVIPFVFVFSPTLLMIGQPIDILFDVVTAFLGVFFISVAGVGWYRTHIKFLKRLVLAAAGVLMLLPDSALDVPYLFDLLGLVLGTSVLWRTVVVSKTTTNTTTNTTIIEPKG